MTTKVDRINDLGRKVLAISFRGPSRFCLQEVGIKVIHQILIVEVGGLAIVHGNTVAKTLMSGLASGLAS